MDKVMCSMKSGTFLDPNQEYVVNASMQDLPPDRLVQLQKKFRTKPVISENKEKTDAIGDDQETTEASIDDEAGPSSVVEV